MLYWFVSFFWFTSFFCFFFQAADGIRDWSVTGVQTCALPISGHCGDGMPIRDDAGQPIQGRCGYGPRLPLIVVSPFAKRNFVDHTLTDLSSIVRFIEDNWGTGRIGGGSFDAVAGPLMNMFDFSDRGSDERQVFLDPATGEPLRP